jgi:AraC family transcriptional regulator
MPELGPNAWKKAATMARIEGVSCTVQSHAVWSGMSATVLDAACSTPSTLADQVDCSRLVVMLAQVGGRVEIGPHRSRRPKLVHDTQHQMSFGPPGAPQWGFFREPAEQLRCIALKFDFSIFASQLEDELALSELCPRYMFFDAEVLHLSRLMEAETLARAPASTLYLDTLSLALVRRLAQLERAAQVPKTRYLPPRQRRAVIDYMRAKLAENVRLAELAGLVDLPPAAFCRAFKESVGLPPHAWQLRERVRLAQTLLLSGGISLAELAASTGFADQAHFTRVFRKVVGSSPHAWRQANRH